VGQPGNTRNGRLTQAGRPPPLLSVRNFGARAAWVTRWAPGCWASSATTRTGSAGPGAKELRRSQPITRVSGRKKTVLARKIRDTRLSEPLHQQAFSALTCSPGARAYYDTVRGRGIGHHAALRQLANRLVGILHGCLKTGTLYHEHQASPGSQPRAQAA
jgi:hypothetical protein